MYRVNISRLEEYQPTQAPGLHNHGSVASVEPHWDEAITSTPTAPTRPNPPAVPARKPEAAATAMPAPAPKAGPPRLVPLVEEKDTKRKITRVFYDELPTVVQAHAQRLWREGLLTITDNAGCLTTVGTFLYEDMFPDEDDIAVPPIRIGNAFVRLTEILPRLPDMTLRQVGSDAQGYRVYANWRMDYVRSLQAHEVEQVSIHSETLLFDTRLCWPLRLLVTPHNTTGPVPSLTAFFTGVSTRQNVLTRLRFPKRPLDELTTYVNLSAPILPPNLKPFFTFALAR